jgi:hypothetical protein
VLEIVVNGEARWRQSGRESWGELLELLEQGHGSSRPIVTAVRFDGVAAPTFREPAILARGVGDVGLIEVETSTFDELLHESAQAAYESVAPLQRAVCRIATSLRGDDPDGTRRDLPSLLAALQGLTVVTSMLTTARGAGGAPRIDFDGLASRLCGVLDGIVECQTHDNWRGVADILERALAPALSQWASILLALNGNAGGADVTPYRSQGGKTRASPTPARFGATVPLASESRS